MIAGLRFLLVEIGKALVGTCLRLSSGQLKAGATMLGV